MDKTLHLKKGIFAIGIACLLFFVSMGVFSVCVMLLEPVPNAPIHPVYMALASACFWGAMSSLAIWMLLAYWRERLAVTEEVVVQRGIFGVKTIPFAEIRRAVWRPAPSQLRLYAETVNLRVYLDNFGPSDRLWLIRRLRDRLPEDVQEGWGRFCMTVAVPLCKQDTRSADPEYVAVTRRRWAWYFVPTTLLFVIVGIVLAWTLELPGTLSAPAPVLILWGFLHFSTPRQGLVVTRVTAVPGQGRFHAFLLAWGCVGLAGCLLFMALKLPVPQTIGWMTAGGIVWFGTLIYAAVQFDRHRQQSNDSRIPHALKEWAEVDSAQQSLD